MKYTIATCSLIFVLVASAASAEVTVSLSFIKDRLLMGEPVLPIVTIENRKGAPVQVPAHDTISTQLEWTVAPEGLRRDKLPHFEGRAETESLPSGARRLYVLKDFGAWHATRPGRYTIIVSWLTSTQEGEAKIQSDPVVLEIKEPAGAERNAYEDLFVKGLAHDAFAAKYPGDNIYRAWGFYSDAFRDLPATARDHAAPSAWIDCIVRRHGKNCPGSLPPTGMCVQALYSGGDALISALRSRDDEPYRSLALCAGEERLRSDGIKGGQPFLERAALSANPFVRDRAKSFVDELHAAERR